MQFVINDVLLENLMTAPESLAQSLIQAFLEDSSSKETADIVLDITQLTLQTNGPAILSKLSEFLGHVLQQKIPVAKIIVQDEWLKNRMIIKANALLNTLFPEAKISIYSTSGQVLDVSTNYAPVMIMPTAPSGEAPYSFYPEINMTIYHEHITKRMAEPFTLNQGQLDACGVTAYLIQVLETQPALYKKIALELVEQGKSESVVSLRAPEPSKLTKEGEFRSSSSAIILNAFQNPLSFLSQIGIPVEIIGWLEDIVHAITPCELSTHFNTFKMYVLEDLSAKLANLPRQVVAYLSRSGYEVTKETAKMLPMEFFKNILSKQQNNSGTESILNDIQRLTYADIHTESSPLTLKSELQEIEASLKMGYQAIILLESKWNWRITGLAGSIAAGLTHYNYCKDFHLYNERGQDKVKFTIYTWGKKFEVITNLANFAQYYCGVILSKPKALLFSKEMAEQSVSKKTRKEYHARKEGNPNKRLEREGNVSQNNSHIRDKSPKRLRKPSLNN